MDNEDIIDYDIKCGTFEPRELPDKKQLEAAKRLVELKKAREATLDELSAEGQRLEQEFELDKLNLAEYLRNLTREDT